MPSLIAIAISLFPELLPLISGKNGDAIATAATEAVAKIGGDSDPAKAEAAIKADSAKSTQLRLQLAQIALDGAKAQYAAEEAERQVELARQRLAQDEGNKKRDADLEALKLQLTDVSGARSFGASLSTTDGPMKWGALLTSGAVIVGFFGILCVIIFRSATIGENSDVLAIINVSIGTLGTAFAAVVGYWVGSSAGSRLKDEANIQNISRQTSDLIKDRASSPAADGAAATTPATPSLAEQSALFDKCLAVTARLEGGYQDGKTDNEAKNLGVTLAQYNAWLSNKKLDPITKDAFKQITLADVKEVYRTDYWNKLQCGLMPAALALTVFDFGVSSDTQTAATALQETIGATSDTSVGGQTLKAVQALTLQRLPTVIITINQKRRDYYQKTFTTNPDLLTKLNNRVTEVQNTSIFFIDS